MSDFRIGNFHRDRVPKLLRRFCPVAAVDSILDIDLDVLKANGKSLILLDVDNTLLEWRSESIPATTHEWITKAKSLDIKLCILSNTKNPERLKRISAALEVPFLRGRFKPSTKMYEAAVASNGVKKEEAVMVGDQIFTDVWGANRSGIEAIWVRQMTPRDFIGTKVSRFGERIVRRRLYNHLVIDDGVPTEGKPIEDLSVGGGAAFDLLSHPTVKQFVKFTVVGATSTLIDIGFWSLLMFMVPFGSGLLSEHLGNWLVTTMPGIFRGLAYTQSGEYAPAFAAGPIFQVGCTGVAILNSFFWNRKWTFKIEGKEHRTVQMKKFFIVAIIGLILNAFITTALSNVIPGHWKRSAAVGKVVATVVVAFWNFFGQKLWTFRKHQ